MTISFVSRKCYKIYKVMEGMEKLRKKRNLNIKPNTHFS